MDQLHAVIGSTSGLMIVNHKPDLTRAAWLVALNQLASILVKLQSERHNCMEIAKSDGTTAQHLRHLQPSA